MRGNPRTAWAGVVLLLLLAAGSACASAATGLGEEEGASPSGAAAASVGSPDCALGCSLSLVAPVCGADGITYMSDCLAICSGTTAVAYSGACLPGGSTEAKAKAASRDPTPTPASLAGRHPIASVFRAPQDVNQQSAQGGGQPAPVATLGDMRRYAREGFVLVGAVPVGSADPDVKLGIKPTSNPDAEARASAEKANDPIEVFEMRVVPSTGLLYTSTKVLRGGAADLALSSPPMSAASHPGPRARRGTTPQLDSGGDAAKINTAWWPEIKYQSVYPWRAVGFLQLFVGARDAGKCTGSLYGPRAMVTAAHCYYDRSTKVFATQMSFSPNHYRTSTGTVVKPFGTHTVKTFSYLSGWVTSSTTATAWLYDIVVAILNTAPSTGYFGYSTAGGSAYAASLNAAGYPASTVTAGEFHYSAYNCDVSDPNGNDSVLNFKSASNPTCPRARCPIAEPGQSGQPVWTGDNNIRGVLSHGPTSYTTCTDWDKYTELDAVNYNFLTNNRMRV